MIGGGTSWPERTSCWRWSDVSGENVDSVFDFGTGAVG